MKVMISGSVKKVIVILILLGGALIILVALSAIPVMGNERRMITQLNTMKKIVREVEMFKVDNDHYPVALAVVHEQLGMSFAGGNSNIVNGEYKGTYEYKLLKDEVYAISSTMPGTLIYNGFKRQMSFTNGTPLDEHFERTR